MNQFAPIIIFGFGLVVSISMISLAASVRAHGKRKAIGLLGMMLLIGGGIILQVHFSSIAADLLHQQSTQIVREQIGIPYFASCLLLLVASPFVAFTILYIFAPKIIRRFVRMQRHMVKTEQGAAANP